MVLVQFNGRVVAKHPIRVFLAEVCEVEGVGFPVPTPFALHLIAGEEEAWRLLEELKRAPFNPRGKKWVLEASNLMEVWRRLEEGLRNAPNGEPKFYRSLDASICDAQASNVFSHRFEESR